MFPFTHVSVIKGPVDLVAAVPYLLGFHPRDCLVCIGVDNGAVNVAAHLRLPAAPDTGPDWATAVRVIAAEGQQVLLLGYGSADDVESELTASAVVMTAAGIEVIAAVRVHAGRIFCLGSGCGCSPDGIPFDPDASTVPAEATLHGIAPLPDRDAVDKLLDPITGADRDRMRAASVTALRQLLQSLSAGTPPRTGLTLAAMLAAGPPRHVISGGITAVRDAFAAAARGQTLTDDAVAWLGAVLLIPDVRDYGYRASDGSDPHRALWIDVTRRAIGVTAAAPACLLAITAYFDGDGALAATAIRRSLNIDPHPPMARLVARLLRAGVAPAEFRQAMTGHS